ncbi:MAG: hypothetical protein COU46_02755 [Candidatus Niyogibacteria bacterium CG10_big_fil_rev_8_21_14_0_10_42_19]|uniref:4Fe-4S ferredoxin-type domain-containing protein n=1 Tax=Candidatus Niyogibacteria bacterium CG10_big_fil_rev_8_21_14_0_10_42_19 TaxID=1974725 RepID=A0A2H0TGR8_9BACT|nr:MAG: hypothetical protein COU46_02755 [Candidatus Niyogibacteria bacterium CG10_big_fil_rev_8_21_14_0_10_42_19]
MLKRITESVSLSQTRISPLKTGLWRKIFPFYEEKKSPCAHFCPCSENIPVWMDLVRRKEFARAWEVLTEENPFPLICGRVCYRFCEEKCNRNNLDDGISINAVERFLGEYGVKNGLFAKAKSPGALEGMRVAVIGAGPAGLSAAHFLAKERAEVVIFDSELEPGGMLRCGIPEYRLPKCLLRAEIRNMVLFLGVRLELGVKIDSNKFAEIKKQFDFIIVALGAHKSKLIARLEDGERVMAGLSFLSSVNSRLTERFPSNIRKICVVGGGNTAIDVSRVALRLGAKTVEVLYRRTKNEMPAHKDEVMAAKKEGVKFSFLVQPLSSRRCREAIMVHCIKMKLSGPDGSGRPTPVEVEGSNFEIKCDLLLYAVGEETDYSLLGGVGYEFKTEDDIVDGNIIFAGDNLYGPRSVSEAVASGKKAAGTIIKMFSHDVLAEDDRKVVYPDDIKLLYVNLRRKNERILHEQELTREEFEAFKETTATISEDTAIEEADRCINCGTCIGCDRCIKFCPDFCIIKKGELKYEINFDFCKGCGICAEVCERGAIDIGKEGEDVRE